MCNEKCMLMSPKTHTQVKTTLYWMLQQDTIVQFLMYGDVIKFALSCRFKSRFAVTLDHRVLYGVPFYPVCS